MAFTINEAMQLPVLKGFRLAAGLSGLNRIVDTITILDFEYENENTNTFLSNGLFPKNSFILTSHLFAKNNPEKIYSAVGQLVADGASALAIKSVYYSKLPREVEEYANSQAFPILFFGVDAGYFEDIIVEVMNSIDEHNSVDLLKEKVSLLLENHLDKADIYRLIHELTPDLVTPYRCYYFQPTETKVQPFYYHTIRNMRNSRNANYFILPYQNGYLMVVSGEESSNYTYIAREYEISINSYLCGMSKEHNKLETISYALYESIYAASYAKKKNTMFEKFEDMGILKLLMPNLENYWTRSY